MPSDDFDDYWFGEEDWYNNNDLIEWGMTEDQDWDREYDEYPPDETDTDIFDEA